ncbi:MAG: hypothetical protein AAFR61_14550 [Bacteroidota bacterium]
MPIPNYRQVTGCGFLLQAFRAMVFIMQVDHPGGIPGETHRMRLYDRYPVPEKLVRNSSANSITQVMLPMETDAIRLYPIHDIIVILEWPPNEGGDLSGPLDSDVLAGISIFMAWFIELSETPDKTFALSFKSLSGVTLRYVWVRLSSTNFVSGKA